MKRALFLMIILSFVLPIQAMAVIYEFTGYISYIEDNKNNALPDIYLHQPIKGWFSYHMVPDQHTYPDYGRYDQITSMEVRLEGSLELSKKDEIMYLIVGNNNSYNMDQIIIWWDFIVEEEYEYNLAIQFIDSTGTVFDSDSLQTNLDLSAFDRSEIFLWGHKNPNYDYFDITGKITSLKLIPEPATIFLIGLGALTAFRRKK